MGRQAVAVWQFSQGIASFPCGLRVLPRCLCGRRALLLAVKESSSTQNASLRYRDVFGPPRTLVPWSHPLLRGVRRESPIGDRKDL